MQESMQNELLKPEDEQGALFQIIKKNFKVS